MKYLITTLFFGTTFSLLSQENKHNVSLTYSNNGNISKEMLDYYFNPIHEYGPGDDVSNYKESAFKFNLNYNLELKESWSIGVSLGYGRRKDVYDMSNLPNFWTGDKFQNYYSLSILGKYFWKLERLEFGTGFEVPINIISDYIINYYQDEPVQKSHSRQKITGGTSFGINSVTSLKFDLTSSLFLKTKISFGFTHLKAGGTVTSSIIEQNPISYSTGIYEYNNSYIKNYFSSPELNLGIGISF